jgi:signal transduction histidine kinase/DNA-binding response OmpR family regulator
MHSGAADSLRLAVEAMADGFISADMRTGDVVINSAARHMLGITTGDTVTTQYLKEVVGFYPFELAGVTPVREELRIGERVLHSVVTPLFDDGNLIGAIVVLRDLGASGEVIRQRAEFAQLMAHELRTPLTSIAGALDIVLSGYAGSLSDKQLRYVDMARQGASRMNQMVDQLLDLARAQAGTITVASTPVLLDRLARDVIRRYTDGALSKQLRIVVSATAEDISILGDPERLGQVLGNLLSNAIRFAPPGGVIGVELFGPPLVRDAVGVSVHNSGESLSVEDRERIFEPFSASSRKIGGTALGLSISRTIIEAHGGRIWADSDATGTKFVFTLPAQNPSLPNDPNMAVMVPASRKLKDGAIALIVDDDPRRALLLKGLLMTTCERVLIANDSDNALHMARNEHPALTVVSGTLINARALISILDHDPDTAATVIMAVAESAQRTALLGAGANDVYEPPLHPTSFREACVRLVESGQRSSPRIMVVDDDAAVRTISKEVLEVGGYQVNEAASGEAALIEARRFRPDLFVLDVMMPHLDGFALAEALRADPVMGMTPIIFLSARADTADKVRAFRAGAEDYIVKPFDAAELLARVGKALSRQAKQLGASPTTQLPGADAIQVDIERRLEESAHDDFVGYLDLDNLKAFNDYYGYAKANAVIRQTGAIIREVVSTCGGAGGFIGHIAGDDFVFVTSLQYVDDVSREICRRFDEIIQLYYARSDREQGYIETKDRFGIMRKFPLMSVSIAAISLRRGKGYAGIAELAALGKRAAKAIPGSSYVRDEQAVSL